nr:DUF3492 domain-containing protein [Streptomyces sp. HNM0574]
MLTEGGYPFARGESVLWCDRLLRGLQGHEFEVYALSRSERQEHAGWCLLPPNVRRVCTAPLWGPAPGTQGDPAGPGAGYVSAYGRRERQRFERHFGQLAEAVCTAVPDELGWTSDAADLGDSPVADRFTAGLYGLAELARDHGGLALALRSEQALRILESACRAPGALRAAQAARVADFLAVADRLERALRPLSLDWYGPRPAGAGQAHGHGPSHDANCRSGQGTAGADLCHAVGAGPAALPGLLAKRFFGTPMLLTEYGVRLREHYLGSAPAVAGAPVRALLASFQRLLAREAYAQAHVITPGNTHARRWQQRCGARREQLRTVYPGMDARPFAEVGEVGEHPEAARPRPGRTGARPATRTGSGAGPPAHRGRRAAPTVVWVGRVEPSKDLIGLLHAFARIRTSVPRARLRVIATRRPRGREGADYGARCWALAAQLFPDEAADARTAGESPVSFEEVGSPGAPTLADAYGGGDVVVLPSAVEGFPVPLVEAMFCGRATVSTDVGAVCEVIGGTGLVVPSRNPRALADSCVTLLRDPERRARLGAAARARALELFTVEQNIAAFRGIYLELMSHCPVRTDEGPTLSEDGDPLPFARPAESHVPGGWARTTRGAVAAAAGGRRPGGRLAQWPPGTRPHAPALPPAGAGRPTAPGGGKREEGTR